MMSQPSAPRGGGRGWKILAVLLLVGLGLSLLANLKQIFTGSITTSYTKSSHQRRHFMEEITVADNGSKNKIAVIDVEGVITSRDENRAAGNMVEDIRRQLKAAAKDPAVKAVVLKVNSPGGEVLASDDIYNAIDVFQQTSGKPVVASMQTLAASGGYYVSAPCRWIVAHEMTITGSIGVIMHGLNYNGLMNKIGVHSETYKSGKFKDMLSPMRSPADIPEEERTMVQGLIMETYEKFTNIVETGRSEAHHANRACKEKGQPLDNQWANYADGRVLSGRQAFDLGFVDELGDFQAAVSRAETLAKIMNADLIQYQQPFDLGDFFRIFGQTADRSVKVDWGVKIPALQPGCLYFIYRQALP